MSEPITPIGKRLAEEAAAAERERLIEQGWHEPRPDCGPIKAQPHEHTYVWASASGTNDPPPTGCPCIGCGHPYGAPEAPTDD